MSAEGPAAGAGAGEAARHRRLKELFARALELTPDERETFLAERCADEPELLVELRELLAQDAAAGTPLDRPAVSRTVGPYRVIERLGAGGMGEVFLAEQERPLRRRVAVKVIRSPLPSREVMARFAAERQALALMEHPAIARVLDAGETDDGRPYFAMEHVPGVPVTDYCDRRRLSTRERLELFLLLCDGVQHAHQKGVIHRDLKPSNLLVTDLDGGPRPKIIDFGIAKAVAQPLTEATLETEAGRAVGTPAYMSPEQLTSGAEGLDTRADVYSLGVVLYELLVGVRPFAGDGAAPTPLPELWRRVQEEDPTAPSTRAGALGEGSSEAARRRRTDPRGLVRRLRGDLDWIVLKALEKDRSRRYSAVSELAADLRRHLRDEPVLAGPPSSAYRLRKLVRRHRAGFAAAALVLAALVVGVVGISLALRRALSAEATAREEAAAAREVSDFLVDLFHTSDPFHEPGQPLTTEELLAGSVERIHRDLADRPLLQSRLLTALGEVFVNLGDYDRAEILAEALRLREAELGPENPDTAESLHQLGVLRVSQGRYSDAVPLLERALALRERLLDPDDPHLAQTVQSLGDALLQTGDRVRAKALLERSLAIRERALGPDHYNLAPSLNNLALVSYSAGDYEEAIRLFKRALAIVEKQLGDHPQVASIVNNVGGCYWAMERYDEAEPYLRRALAIRRRTLPAGHPDIGKSLSNLGELLVLRGKPEEARQAFDRALEILGGEAGSEALTAAYPHLGLGRLYLGEGRFGLARQELERALAIRLRFLQADHPEVAEVRAELAKLPARTAP